MIQFPPFEPDKSVYTTGADGLINVYPVADGWGAMPGLIEVSEALDETPLGGIYGADTTGNFFSFVGTASGIYKFEPGTGTWADVSRAGGYDVKDGARWRCIRWGDYLVFTAPSSTGSGQPPQYYNLNSSSVFEDIPNADFEARYVCGAGDFVVFAYTDDATSGQTQIRWSGLNEIDFWSPGERLSDFTYLPEGGEIMGLVSHGVDGFCVIQRNAIRPYSRVPGNPYVFLKGAANEARGSIAPHSIVTFGAGAFAYYSEDGFHANVEGTPIGAERVNRWVQNNVSSDDVGQITGVLDPFQKIIWWRFDGASGAKYLIGWAYQLDRWCRADIDAIMLLPGAMPAETLESLTTKYGALDDIPYPIGSRLFQGGRPVFGVFTSDNKLAFFAGAPMAATLTTALTALNGEYRRTFVRGARLMGDVAAGGYTITPMVQDYHGGTIGTQSPATASTIDGEAKFRSSARIHAFKVEIAEGTDWETVMGISPNAIPEGMR